MGRGKTQKSLGKVKRTCDRSDVWRPIANQ